MASEERAQVEVTGDSSKLLRALGVAGKALSSFSKTAGKSVNKALGAIGGQLSAIAGLAGVGGFAVMGAEALKFEESLTRLSIAADFSAAQTETLRGVLNTTSDDFGVAREKILDGVNALVDLQGASAATPENVHLIAKAMQATGAEAQELAGTIFALADTFGLDPSQYEAALSGVAAQGKAASIPLKELSTTLQQQAANLSQITGGGLEGVAKTNAILQTLRKGFGSAAEAGTGAKAIGQSFKKNAKQLKKYGVQVFRTENGKKVFRDLRDILVDIGDSKLAKDPTLLTKALGSSEAETAVTTLLKNLDVYDQLVESGRDYNTIQRDANKFMSSAVGRQQAAMNKLRNAVQNVFSPEVIEAFALALEVIVAVGSKIIEKFVALTEKIWILRKASDALANVLADITGLNEKVNLQATQGNLLLAEQTRAFGEGKVSDRDRKLIETFGKAAPGTVEEKAAGRIVRAAERDKLIRGGQIDHAVAERTLFASAGTTPAQASAAQRDVVATQIAGLERAIKLDAEARRRQGIDVNVNVKVNNAQAETEVREARNG